MWGLIPAVGTNEGMVAILLRVSRAKEELLLFCVISVRLSLSAELYFSACHSCFAVSHGCMCLFNSGLLMRKSPRLAPGCLLSLSSWFVDQVDLNLVLPTQHTYIFLWSKLCDLANLQFTHQFFLCVLQPSSRSSRASGRECDDVWPLEMSCHMMPLSQTHTRVPVEMKSGLFFFSL